MLDRHSCSPPMGLCHSLRGWLLLAAILVNAPTIEPTTSLAQEAPLSPPDWVEHVAPGVRLVGRPNSPQGNHSRKLYEIAPLPVLRTLRAAIGLPNEWQAPLQAVVLAFDPSGEIVRDVYIENQEIVRLRLTQTGTGRRISETRLHSGLSDLRQLSGEISPDGRRAALAKQCQLEVLDAMTGEVLQSWQLPQNVRRIKLDRRGEFVAVALGHYFWNARIQQLRIFRVSDGHEVLVLDRPGIVEFGFQPGSDRLYVLTSGEENELRFFDRDTWQETWRHATSHAPAYGMAMSSTGHEIAIGLRDSRVEFWRLSDLQRASPPARE